LLSQRGDLLSEPGQHAIGALPSSQSGTSAVASTPCAAFAAGEDGHRHLGESHRWRIAAFSARSIIGWSGDAVHIEQPASGPADAERQRCLATSLPIVPNGSVDRSKSRYAVCCGRPTAPEPTSAYACRSSNRRRLNWCASAYRVALPANEAHGTPFHGGDGDGQQ
jgi:hypothetical protein